MNHTFHHDANNNPVQTKLFKHNRVLKLFQFKSVVSNHQKTSDVREWKKFVIGKLFFIIP
jgi:hypothetical protein